MARDAFTYNSKNIDRFEKDLARFGKLAIPIANQKALSAGAKDAKETAHRHVDEEMTLRNKWTKGSIQSVNAKGLFMSQQAAIVGSKQEYMADQEFGATKVKGGGKEGLRMTTSVASGEGRNANPRKKLAMSSNKIRKIRLQKTKKRGVNRAQQNIISIAEARKSGRKHVFLDFPGRAKSKGIYRIKGGKKNPKIDMIHSLHMDTAVVKKSAWLGPSVRKVIPRMSIHYQNALAQQRHFFKKRYNLR